MRRLIGVLLLLGALSLTMPVSSAAAQSGYGAGDWGSWWYGPFAYPGHLSGPYGSIGATGFGSTGFGCGQGAYGFSNYGHGTMIGAAPLEPTCGGFGNYPYLYPYYTGYPYSNGMGPMGGLALASMGNPNPFVQTVSCNALLLGSSNPATTSLPFPGAAGQFSIGANQNVLNLANPAFSTLQQFGTFTNSNLFGCAQLR